MILCPPIRKFWFYIKLFPHTSTGSALQNEHFSLLYSFILPASIALISFFLYHNMLSPPHKLYQFPHWKILQWEGGVGVDECRKVRTRPCSQDEALTLVHSKIEAVESSHSLGPTTCPSLLLLASESWWVCLQQTYPPRDLWQLWAPGQCQPVCLDKDATLLLWCFERQQAAMWTQRWRYGSREKWLNMLHSCLLVCLLLLLFLQEFNKLIRPNTATTRPETGWDLSMEQMVKEYTIFCM